MNIVERLSQIGFATRRELVGSATLVAFLSPCCALRPRRLSALV